MKRLIPIIYIFLTIGCVSDYDGPIPVSAPFPALNGVLYADSAFSVCLTWSNHPTEKQFNPITNADFIIWKNGKKILPDYIFKDDGTYTFDDTCHNGDKFKIEVNIPGFPILKSETKIPLKPEIKIIQSDSTENNRNDEIFNVEVSNIGDDIHALYFFLFVNIAGDLNSPSWEQRGIYCDSPLADSFNRFYDTWAPSGFTYEYESFVRFPVENLPGKKIQSRLALIGGSISTRIYVISATKEFDLYFKGGYLQRTFDPTINLPFTYQPIFVPSNINGGAGIFSGIDLSSFEFINKN